MNTDIKTCPRCGAPGEVVPGHGGIKCTAPFRHCNQMALELEDWQAPRPLEDALRKKCNFLLNVLHNEVECPQNIDLSWICLGDCNECWAKYAELGAQGNHDESV